MGGLRGADGIIGYDRLYPSDRAYIAVVRHPGFLAAVNMLLQSAAYALMDRGHLFVDFSRAPFDMTDVFKARFAGPEAYDQRRYAPKLRTPTLLYTTADDATVANGPAFTFARTAPPGMVTHIATQGDHTEAWNVDPSAYETALRLFLTKVR